jgi:hypothetical protein
VAVERGEVNGKDCELYHRVSREYAAGQVEQDNQGIEGGRRSEARILQSLQQR